MTFSHTQSADPSVVIDGDTKTGVVSSHQNWQHAQIDLGCTSDLRGIRRHMEYVQPNLGDGLNRGEQGERVSVSLDGITWTDLAASTTSGWEAYNNDAPVVWHTVPYGWSRWLRPNEVTSVRYVRFRWDGDYDALREIDIDFTNGPEPTGVPNDDCTKVIAEIAECRGPWRVNLRMPCLRQSDGCPCKVHEKMRGTVKDELDANDSTISVRGDEVFRACWPSGCVDLLVQDEEAALQNCQNVLDTVVASVEGEHGPPNESPNYLTWRKKTASVSNPTGNNNTGWMWSCEIVAEYTLYHEVDNPSVCKEHEECWEYHSTCATVTERFDYEGKSASEVEDAECPLNSNADGSTPENALGDCGSHLDQNCVTGDDIPEPVVRFRALTDWLDGDLAGAENADPDVRDKLHANLQLAYEVSGTSLTAEERARARQSYQDHPGVLQCGATVDTSILGHCPQTDWKLQYCTRMTGNHVDPELLWNDTLAVEPGGKRVPDFCADLLPELAGQQCTLQNAIDEAFLTSRNLLDSMGSAFEAEFTTARCVVLEPGAARQKRMDAAEKMFASINQWHARLSAVAGSADEGARITAERLDDELSKTLGDLWIRVDKALGFTENLLTAVTPGSNLEPCTPPDPGTEFGVIQILQETAQRAIEADQDLVVGAVRALEGLPLLAVLGHITQSEIARLEAQKSSHDLACRFSGCRSNDSLKQTRVAYLYRLLSLFDDVSGLEAALTDATAPATPWHESFVGVQGEQSRIIDALNDLLSDVLIELQREAYAPDVLDRVDITKQPRSARAILDGLRRAKMRYQAYSSTGEFALDPGRYLRTRVNYERRDEIAAVVEHAVTNLADRVTNFEGRIGDVIEQVAGATTNDANITLLEATRKDLFEELGRVDSRVAAHTRASRGSDISDQITKAWLDVNGILESGGVPTQFIQIDQVPADGVPLQITGIDAPQSMTGVSLIDDLAVVRNGGLASTTISAGPGEVITIEVPSQDQWAPRCSLESVRIAGDSGSEHDIVAPLTGPGGYTLVEENSTFRGESDTKGWTHQGGFKTSVCMRGKTPLASFLELGLHFESCVYQDSNFTASNRKNEGSNNRTSAAFQGGFYLPERTPFYAPVGSLLLVEMPAGEKYISQALDVHVIRSPISTVVVRAGSDGVGQGPGSDFYLVVNDLQMHCERRGVEPDSTYPLNVTMRRLHSEQAQAQATLGAMGGVVSFMRGKEKELIQQRDILPHQLTDIVNEARRILPASVRSDATYPPALRQVFDALIVAEKTRLEHAVRLSNLEDERNRILDQLNIVSSDLRYAERTGALLHTLPRWSARNLDIEELTDETARLMELLADYMFPVVETWYPGVLTALNNSTLAKNALLALESQRPGTSLYELSANTRLVGQFIVDRLREQALLVADENIQPVALTFLRPVESCNPLVCTPTGPTTPYPRADAARANAVWSALDAGLPVTLHIRPEDLYRPNGGGAGRISCKAPLPIIRRIGLALVNPTGIPTPPTVGEVEVTVDVTTSSEQQFARIDEPISYELLGNEYERIIFPGASPNHLRNILHVPIVRASQEQSSPRYVRSMLDFAWNHSVQEPVGRSPFASFAFDITGAYTPGSVINPSVVAAATELVIMMTLEYTVGGSSLAWVSSCQETEICNDAIDNDGDGAVDCADGDCFGNQEDCPGQ